MVSNARLDLPEPERPVTTGRLLRGISTEMFFSLWPRAPCTATEVRMTGGPEGPPLRRGEPLGSPVFLFAIGKEERELLQRRAAALGGPNRRRRLGDQPLVGEILARGGHALHVEPAREV